jgi:hypothetical protein
MDPSQARRLQIDRRREGMRRQRRVTQATAAGAVVAAVAFGWAFAHESAASAGTADSTQPSQTGTTTGGAGGTLRQPDQVPAAADSTQADLQSGGS